MAKESKEVRIARLEEKHLAMQEALTLARGQLSEYKAQSNEWRAENIEIQNTRQSVDGHKGDMKAINQKFVSLEEKVEAKFDTVLNRVDMKNRSSMIVIITSAIMLAALIISLFTILT